MTTTETDPSQQPNPGEGNQATNVATTTVPDPSAGAGTEGKDGEAKTALTTDGQAKPDVVAAPETYEAFTVPEGLVLEGERLDQATAFFKEQGWTQEQAQKAVDFYSGIALKDAEAISGSVKEQLTQAMEAEKAQKIEKWGVDAKTQLGEGYDAAVSDARLFVQTVNNPELVAAFEGEGWGNHPELIKAFAFAGKMARDSNVHGLGGQTAASAEKSAAALLFNHPTSQTTR